MREPGRWDDLGFKAEGADSRFECFIAIHEGNLVHTLSGEIDTYHSQHVRTLLDNGETDLRVDIKFRGNVTEKLRPFEGSVGE